MGRHKHPTVAQRRLWAESGQKLGLGVVLFTIFCRNKTVPCQEWDTQGCRRVIFLAGLAYQKAGSMGQGPQVWFYSNFPSIFLSDRPRSHPSGIHESFVEWMTRTENSLCSFSTFYPKHYLLWSAGVFSKNAVR